MISKIVLIILLPLLILTGSWKICGAEESTSNVIVETDLPSLKKLDECIQRQPILEDLVKEQTKTITELKSSLANKSELLELEKRENEINQKMIEIKDKEIVAVNKNFEQMKEVTDRAIKLAEVSKGGGVSQNTVLGGIVGIVVGLIIHGIIW